MRTGKIVVHHGDATPLQPQGAPSNAVFGMSGPVGNAAIQDGTFRGPGAFGKMFPDLAPLRVSDPVLSALGEAMEDTDFGPDLNPNPDDPTGDNPVGLPAGYTYLGQFVDHDITFDRTIGFPEQLVPGGVLQNARTPTLELDSVYGMGPEQQPELFDPTFPPSEARFRIGKTSETPSPDENNVLLPTALPFDLPREDPATVPPTVTLKAIIGDPRNDENLLVAQMHLLFLRLHNKVIGDDDAINAAPQSAAGKPRFEKARRLVRWHYQWIVLRDFLPRLILPDVLEDVLKNGRKFFRPAQPTLFMPVEHSVAAYRLGHTMIRESYDYNRVFQFGTNFGAASLALLFNFTGNATNSLPGLPPGAPIPSNWIIDWRRFFDLDPAVPPNKARAFDTRIANPLKALLEFVNDPLNQPPALSKRNLLRGSRVGLPSGQDVAKAIGAEPLTDKLLENAAASEDKIIRDNGLQWATPLWFYILKEAEVTQGRERLGPVGSRILAETFVGLLQLDDPGSNGTAEDGSFLAIEPGWTPTLPSATAGEFTMADLIRYVGDISPIDGI